MQDILAIISLFYFVFVDIFYVKLDRRVYDNTGEYFFTEDASVPGD